MRDHTCESLEGRRLFTAVTVGNASFESAVGGDDAPIGVAVWSIPGSVGNAYNPIDSGYNNATDTGPTGGNLPSPGSGRQVLFINNAGTAKQTLTKTLSAKKAYRLTVAIGDRKDLVMENYRISLYAGTTRIATFTGDGEAAPNGGFVDVSAESEAYASSSSLVGKQLAIWLENRSTKAGAPLQVNFDNVRLTEFAAPVPETINVGNGSFESAVGGDDAPIGVAVWSIPGSIGNAYNPVNSGYTNATDTSSTAGKLPSPGDGRQVLFINNAGTAKQTLAKTFAANRIYRLTVAIGDRKDLVMENYRIALYAGTVSIASTTGDGEAALDGSFTDVTVKSVPVGTSSSLVGKPLSIWLENRSTKAGAPLQVNFDNVRLTSIAAPVAVTVGNASFESVAGADDAPIGVAVWDIPGSIGNAYNPVNSGYTNATDTSPTAGVLPAPGAGKQVLFINGAGVAKQTLGAVLEANKTYKVVVAVGNRGDLVMQNYRISLYAGSTQIATATGDGETAAPNFGFADVSVQSAAFTSGGLIGQPLSIRLENLNTKAGGAVQVNFDNVRLTSTVV